jgi:hypothetical protein
MLRLTSAEGWDMAKEKIVRCIVKKCTEDGDQGSVRYVPLEVFDLWQWLMVRKHSFRVEVDCASLWFDIDGDPNINYAETNYEPVVRLSLWVYSGREGMFRKIVRYFPAGRYEEIKPRFLSHYREYFNGAKFPPRIDETRGVWLKRKET